MVQEAFHSLNLRTKGKKGWMTLKLDMSKTYDRMEWCFVEKVLYDFGFHPKWFKWCMECVQTVSYKVRVNGEVG